MTNKSFKNIQLRKMDSQLGETVNYFLSNNNDTILLNDFLNKPVKIHYLNEILCVNCGKKTKKSFYQGYCYPCFLKCPETTECVIKPELCRAHLGEGKDIDWERENHDTAHVVYLSLTSGVKVGVTRKTQIPTRWIDQGAIEAVFFAETPNRYIAGLIECDIAKHITDKTAWQRMLKGDCKPVNLLAEKQRLSTLLNSDYFQYLSNNDEVTRIEYPLLSVPEKVKSISFDKAQGIEGILTGIKGQYLIFDNCFVINIRKHGGYVISIDVSGDNKSKIDEDDSNLQESLF